MVGKLKTAQRWKDKLVMVNNKYVDELCQLPASSVT